MVAPTATDELRANAAAGTLVHLARDVVEHDLDGAFLAVVATGVAQVDDAVALAAERRGVLVNRADRSELGQLSFAAVVRRGPVQFAVSTGGAAPAVTRWLGEVLDEGLDRLIGLSEAQLRALVEVVAEVRCELSADATPSVTLDWRSALDESILDDIRQGRRAGAKERLLACLSSS